MGAFDRDIAVKRCPECKGSCGFSVTFLSVTKEEKTAWFACGTCNGRGSVEEEVRTGG